MGNDTWPLKLGPSGSVQYNFKGMQEIGPNYGLGQIEKFHPLWPCLKNLDLHMLISAEHEITADRETL